MRSTLTIVLMILATVAVAGNCSPSHAVVIVENFESQTAGSPTVPSGWTLVTAAGAPTYATTAAGQGSNGAGGSSGLAGRVSSTAFVSSNHPGGLLVNNAVFDATQSVRGRFDFYIVHEEAFDDITFSFGDISTGVSGTAGRSITFKAIESTDLELLANGANAVLTGAHFPGIIDDTWFRARFQWTPTSGTTGNFSVTVESSFTSDLFTLSTTGFTLDSAAAQIGFGSVNDTLRFDNVNVASGPAVISNLSNLGSTSSGISTGSGKALNFTMAGTGDFKLTEIILDLGGIEAGDNPLVELWSNSGSGIASLLETLSDPASLVNGYNVFSSTLGSLLLEGETYWVVVRSQAGSFTWRGSSDLSFESDFGATHTGRLFGSGTPSGWASTSGVMNLMQINAIMIPEPHSILLGGLGMIGVALCCRRRRHAAN